MMGRGAMGEGGSAVGDNHEEMQSIVASEQWSEGVQAQVQRRASSLPTQPMHRPRGPITSAA